MILLLAAIFILTLVTGPAWEDWRRVRRERKDFPVARVEFLLPSVCETTLASPVRETTSASPRSDG